LTSLSTTFKGEHRASGNAQNMTVKTRKTKITPNSVA
jgi:hypothetical protein